MFIVRTMILATSTIVGAALCYAGEGGGVRDLIERGLQSFESGGDDLRAFASDVLERYGHDPACFQIELPDPVLATVPDALRPDGATCVRMSPKRCANEYELWYCRDLPGALHWGDPPSLYGRRQREIVECAYRFLREEKGVSEWDIRPDRVKVVEDAKTVAVEFLPVEGDPRSTPRLEGDQVLVVLLKADLSILAVSPTYWLRKESTVPAPRQ